MIILVSDYDNTLGFENGVSKEDLDAIKRFRSNGNKFFVCTGRGPYKFEETVYFDVDGILTCSGGCIEIEDEIETYPISDEVVPSLLDFLTKEGAYAITENTVDNKSFLSDDPKIKEECIKRFGVLLDKPLLNDVLSISARFNSQEKAGEIVKKIEEKYKDSLCAKQNKHYVDISRFGINKVWACEHLKEKYNCDNLFTIGDNLNDLDMIVAFNGACIKSGNDYVKENATDVVSSVSEYIDLLMKRY